MKAPGESAGGESLRDLRRRRPRDVTGEAVVESNVPDVAAVADASVKGARIGEATLLVRYQGNFATLPVTVLNPKPGFAWKPLPQNNYIDRADRRQAAAAEDPAVAGGGRCRVSAPRVARSQRPVAHAGGSAGVRRGRFQNQAQRA